MHCGQKRVTPPPRLPSQQLAWLWPRVSRWEVEGVGCREGGRGEQANPVTGRVEGLGSQTGACGPGWSTRLTVTSATGEGDRRPDPGEGPESHGRSVLRLSAQALASRWEEGTCPSWGVVRGTGIMSPGAHSLESRETPGMGGGGFGEVWAKAEGLEGWP